MSSPASSVSKAAPRKKAATARKAPATPKKAAQRKPLTDAEIYPHQEVLLYDPQPKQIRMVRQDGMIWFAANDIFRLFQSTILSPCFNRDMVRYGQQREIITYDPATKCCYAMHYVCLFGLHELLIRFCGNSATSRSLWAELCNRSEVLPGRAVKN